MSEIISSVLGRFRPELQERKERRQQLARLRKEVHAQIARETEERIETNSIPTETELCLGCFVEELEPQVRDAILELYRKGYSTNASGFWGKHSELQAINGRFILDEDTKDLLKLDNITVEDTSFWGEPGSYISFKPQEADLGKMKEKWDEVVAQLPDTGQVPKPTANYGSTQFRKTYGPKTSSPE